MALYKNPAFLKKDEGVRFDAIHEPGQAAPYPGIYRCQGCDREIALADGHKLPPQNHHQHTPSQGRIRWQLAVTHA